MKTLVEIVLMTLALVDLLLSRFALFRIHQPTTPVLWMLKVFVSGLSPILLVIAVSIGLLGIIINSVPVVLIAALSALLYLIHIITITRAGVAEGNLTTAVQQGNQIAGKTAGRLSRRYVFLLPRESAVVEKDIAFCTIESGRELLCDIWRPSKGVRYSGLAFVYLHGAAWAVLDKDVGTRIFFQHLASQGHVIMDVAYRLFPETDFMGMVHDAKRAVAWMKSNATKYNVNPERIVIGGGSSGAHIALMAAYTNKNMLFAPIELRNTDLSVYGVVSFYGQSDLVATYYHTCQHLSARSSIGQKKDDGQGGLPRWVEKSMGKDFHRLGFDKNVEPGMLAPMLGGNPDEKPDAYSLFSPLNYVHKDCPATLIIHGEHDILAPLKPIRELYTKLSEAGIPVAMHVLEQTDHAFDLILPRISPSAQNAIYDVDGFLAVMASGFELKGRSEDFEHRKILMDNEHG